MKPEQLRAALARTTGARVAVRETHISWVFLAGDRAFKLKKPLVLPFLDYGSVGRRRRMCGEEVRLNRRLAPEVYLGVSAVIETPDGLALAAETDPRAVDYIVEMRRYDERRTLAALLHSGELALADADAVGRRLAAFHEGCRPARGALGGARGVLAETSRNVEELLGVAKREAEQRDARELGRFLAAFAEAHRSDLDERHRRSLTREGHGDLRAEHVVMGPELQIVDCVEFDERLRTLDVADDLAFLLMDLTARGGGRFAERVKESYRRAGGDCGDDALVNFFAVHRALVRAKVLLVRAAQQPEGGSDHGHLSAQARDLIRLARLLAWRARLPLAIAVCGPPASGKSMLAAVLSEESGLAPISSDLVRKGLAGVAPTAAAGAQHYREEFSVATYHELGRRAAREVSAHGGAIIDATFRRRGHRDAFVAAFGTAAPIVFVQCDAPADVLLARARARRRDPRAVSDADEAVVARERERWEDLDEIEPAARTIVASDRPVTGVRGEVLAWLDQALAAGGQRGTTRTAHSES